MGNHLICVSCIQREQEEQNIKDLLQTEDWTNPLDASTLAQRAAAHAEKCRQQSNAPSSSDDELKAHINAIVNASAQRPRQSPVPFGSDSDLKDRINAIVNARAEQCKKSPAPFSSGNELQDQISGIVEAHGKSLKQQRLAYGVSPSPAKSLSNTELAYYAHLALSGAKERQTPAKFSSPACVQWPCDHDIEPCRLSFAEGENTFEAQTDAPSTEPRPALSCIVEPKEEFAEDEDAKLKARPFDVSDIPSPTRNRAKRQQKLWAAAATGEEDASCLSMWDEVQQTSIEGATDEAWQNVADEEAEEQAEQEIDAFQEVAPAAFFPPPEAMWLQQVEEEAELAAMDKMCVDTFLESVKKCARHERVRTPIKGTNLYTKHIRPCRPAGTSVDVKDSSFKSLACFLKFLEAEGLLVLKPGLTDPVVTEIRFGACRNYTYNPRPQASTIKEAPHDEGCCCRLCTSTTQAIGFQYQ